MAYLVGKLAVFAVLVLVASSQAATTFSSPDPSWDTYQIKSCCKKGFVEVLNYCVQCNAPNVFDGIDNRCRPCPADHVFNNATKQCDCRIECELPRQLSANNICECPADEKGNKRVWDSVNKKCNCPDSLPLWNGRYCVACPVETTFDPK